MQACQGKGKKERETEKESKKEEHCSIKKLTFPCRWICLVWRKIVGLPKILSSSWPKIALRAPPHPELGHRESTVQI